MGRSHRHKSKSRKQNKITNPETLTPKSSESENFPEPVHEDDYNETDILNWYQLRYGSPSSQKDQLRDQTSNTSRDKKCESYDDEVRIEGYQCEIKSHIVYRDYETDSDPETDEYEIMRKAKNRKPCQKGKQAAKGDFGSDSKSSSELDGIYDTETGRPMIGKQKLHNDEADYYYVI